MTLGRLQFRLGKRLTPGAVPRKNGAEVEKKTGPQAEVGRMIGNLSLEVMIGHQSGTRGRQLLKVLGIVNGTGVLQHQQHGKHLDRPGAPQMNRNVRSVGTPDAPMPGNEEMTVAVASVHETVASNLHMPIVRALEIPMMYEIEGAKGANGHERHLEGTILMMFPGAT
eukprot:symbB.v1.2.014127.t1/scaffold1024.1/size143406/3